MMAARGEGEGGGGYPNYTCTTTVGGHPARIICVLVGDGLLFTGSSDKSIRVLDADTKVLLYVLEGHASAVSCLTHVPANNALVSGGEDGRMLFHDLTTRKLVHSLPGAHLCRVWSLLTVPGTTLSVSCSHDKSVKVWDVAIFKCEHTLAGHTDIVYALANVPGNLVASGSGDGSIRVWNPSTGQCVRTIHIDESWIMCVLWVPGLDFLASGCRYGRIKLLDIATGEIKANFTDKHSSYVWGLAVVPGTTLLASCSEDELVKVWDVTTGECVQTLRGHRSYVNGIAVDPSTGALLSFSWYKDLKVWSDPKVAEKSAAAQKAAKERAERERLARAAAEKAARDKHEEETERARLARAADEEGAERVRAEKCEMEERAEAEWREAARVAAAKAEDEERERNALEEAGRRRLREEQEAWVERLAELRRQEAESVARRKAEEAEIARLDAEKLRRMASTKEEEERKVQAEEEQRRVTSERSALMKPLEELTLGDVETLLGNFEALRTSATALTAAGMSGDALMMVESADELKDVGVQLIAARLLYSKLQGWKVNGVERSLLVRKAPCSSFPAPPAISSFSVDLPTPPPNPTSPGGPLSSRRVGSVRLSGSIETGGRRSSGDTVIMNGELLLATSSISIIAKVGRDLSLIQREHDIMSELFSTSGRHFIKPYGGVLSGASGDIITERAEDDLTSRYAILMEKGSDDLSEFLLKKPIIMGADLLHIGSSLVDIVEVAHKLGYVMMDFKPQNVVRMYDGVDNSYKAIDFDSWRRSGDDITSDGTTTPSIASPEMARLLLSKHERKPSPKTFASPANDIFALGLTLFFIANSKRSFWRALQVDDSDPTAVLRCSSTLTDSAVQGVLDQCFPEEKRRSLRTLLGDMLQVNPDKRYTATQLKTSHSFFGAVDPTFNPSRLAQDMSKLATKGDIDSAKKDMKDGFQKVQLSLEEMHEKLDHLAMSQSELGTLMRQAAADAAENQGDLKRRFEALADTMTSSMRGAESCLGAVELKSLIQSVVKSSIDATSGMGEELKSFIRDTVVQCADNADRTSQAEQLRQIMETLVSLKDDVLNVSSEIKELRADLAKVNETLGSRLNVLHTMVMNEKHLKFSPITILIFPHHSKNVLKMMKNTFSSEYVIFFVCPVTKKVMKSGPKGRGYKFRVMKDWVKRVAPVLIMTLKICALAAAAYGVPLPIPALPGGGTTEALVNSMVEDIGGIVQEKMEGWTAEQNEEREDAFETAKGALKLCEGTAAMSAAKREREVGKMSRDLESTMGDQVYPAIRDLLKQLEGVKGHADEKWMPQHTGLEMVDCDVDGSTAWVSEEGKAAYKAKGMAAIFD